MDKEGILRTNRGLYPVSVGEGGEGVSTNRTCGNIWALSETSKDNNDSGYSNNREIHGESG